MIVFESVQTISRTEGIFVLEIRRTSFPLFVDTQSSRPGFPGLFHEKAKCLLFGAQTGRDGVVPVSFGDANMSSRVRLFSCALTVTVTTVSRLVINQICQKELFFMCLN